MSEKPVETLKLPDAVISLRRRVELKYSPTESEVGDHMTVQHITGSEENVVVTKGGGQPKLKRLVMHMDIASSSPALPAMTGFHFSLADLAEEDEKQLLKIYNMFPKEAA